MAFTNQKNHLAEKFNEISLKMEVYHKLESLFFIFLSKFL